jgi:hypothetical protein
MGTITRSRYLFVVFCPVRALSYAIRGPTAFICKRAAMAGKDRHMEAFRLTAVSGQARPSRKLAAAPALMRAAHV